MSQKNKINIGIVIPCYKVGKSINAIVENLVNLKLPYNFFIKYIVIVDDNCPDNSTKNIHHKLLKNPKVITLMHKINLGVGGAVKTGYNFLLKKNVNFIIKIDGDGQMDTKHIKSFVNHAISGNYSYVKGNRFYNYETIKTMPLTRLLGNAILSFLNKISSGYWDIFDPTNGYTLIKKNALEKLDIDKINNRYFFESDMLFRLSLIRARVSDFPIQAIYGSEESNLKVYKIIGPFLYLHFKNFIKRFFYLYILRDISVASFEFILGLPLFIFGFVYGVHQWNYFSIVGQEAPTGTIILISLALIFGVQFLLGFINYDINNNPNKWPR